LLFLKAISRRRAAQQKTEKQLGGATRLSELSVFYEQCRAVPQNAGPSERLPFLSPLRCWFVFFRQVKKMNINKNWF